VRLEFGTDLRPWQAQLEAKLNGPADERSVSFVYDPEGNKGKTWFCRYYISNHPTRAQMLGPGKRDDIAYMVDNTKTVFFFNIPRGQSEYFQFSILEQLKDRMVISTKYSSCVKMFRHKVHVVVFTNEPIDMTKMSQDRYEITNI